MIVTDFISDINPLETPKLIWQYVQPYLDKYGVSFTANAPEEKPEGPIIAWKTIRRTPGNKQRVQKHPRYMGQTNNADNTTTKFYTQLFTVIVEYRIYHPSSSVLSDLAWDFENAVLASKSPIAAEFTQFDIEFLEQPEDQLLAIRRSTQYEMLPLRFILTVPVTYRKIFRTLRNIRWLYWSNSLMVVDDELVRPNDSLEFEIPLQKYQQVERVLYLQREIDGEFKDLEVGTDYRVKRIETAKTIIEWLPFGSVPDVGETFRATYSIQNIVDEFNT